MSFNIYMPARIISGENCVCENDKIFTNYGKSCLIVTGGSSAEKSGALKDVTQALSKYSISYEIFDGVKQNPRASDCIKAGEKARKIGADFIVGIGGGSPLDSAKAIAICAKNPEYDIKGLYGRNIPSKALPVILVGTTSGTGSEVTGVSVLTNDETGMKKSISGADCYAAVSFLDSKYTFSMPYDVTVSTALDAFSHAVEGWFSPKCTAIPEAYARTALPLIFRGLDFLNKTKTAPDKKLRDDLYMGSVYAGLELNICGAAFPHTVGYILTENFSISHGKACTAFMPYFLKKAERYAPERLGELLKILGTSLSRLEAVIKELTDVKGIKAENAQLEEWCSRWGYVKNFDNTPGGFTNKEAVEALTELL